jgi:hypothetical protein
VRVWPWLVGVAALTAVRLIRHEVWDTSRQRRTLRFADNLIVVGVLVPTVRLVKSIIPPWDA